MKKTLLLALLFTTASSQAQTIAQWTFETSGADISGTSTSFTGIAPEIGTGAASGVHASASAWSSPAGNGSVESFSVNTWAVGDYFQFPTSTLGFSDISVSYDQISSGTGPGQFTFAYSTDGSSFTQVGDFYTLIANTSPNNWTSTEAKNRFLI